MMDEREGDHRPLQVHSWAPSLSLSLLMFFTQPFSLWPLHTHNRGTICFSEWICFSQWASEKNGKPQGVHTQARALPGTQLPNSSSQ